MFAIRNQCFSAFRRSFSTQSANPDQLYKRLILRVNGHDPAVLKSYEKFTLMAANELGIHLENVIRPLRPVIEKRVLLRSAHIHKKHREHYERRTYKVTMEFKHLTGSTADTFLEYVERNLPEGVAMQ
ncbi:putative 28S ribosomal protein S10-like isoform X2, partial [Leptotrombidium deliense]